ncbi:DNA primase [Candidatus Peregrinibacteria bacterium CG_4_10_14_0_2_um_filter_43_11]|nr:MAG: DNA primase [Candidatus Peregrinibacteria bacterium CG_4_10_14_0_2_um_filter_43_11]
MDHLEEIKSKMSIEELVGGYVQLKKAGRSLKGLCPFHNEKTPSFVVSPDKEIAYCFGCHQGGDIFKFVQLAENCDFNEAVKILAEKTHVALPRALPRLQNKRLNVIAINREASTFFTEQLYKHAAEKNYFLERGLTEETIRHFQLGYAPDSFSAIKDHLTKQFPESELIEAGILSQRSIADKHSYDRFRKRLIFPIFDHQDNPVGFSGRVIDEGEPKYLNSPDTSAYNKSMVLYGLNWAKDAIKKQDMAIFVEGYMDVITAHQAGTLNVIATSGTALTPQQLKLIKRYTTNIAFAFDQDPAGMQATLRAIELAQLAELNAHIIMVPNGKDPDECIRRDPEGWKTAVKKPISSMDFYFAYAKKNFDPETLEGKKEMLNLLLPLIRQYSTETEQSYYLERLALEIKTDVRHLWSDLKKTKSTPSWQSAPESATKKEPGLQKVFTREMFLLGFIFQFPELYDYVHDNLIDNIPFDPGTERFYNACKTMYKQGGTISIETLKTELPPEDSEWIDIYRLLIEERYPDFSDEAVVNEIKELVSTINRKNLKSAQKEVEFKIRSSTEVQDGKILLNQYNEILKLTAKLN